MTDVASGTAPGGGREIHFELFRKSGPKGGWALAEVYATRDAALTAARAMLAGEGVFAVRVVKETYTPATGQYLSLKVFEEAKNGAAASRNDADDDEKPNALPCFRPDDLYSVHARATIHRLIQDWLARERITVMELIHRADLLEKLDATGTLMQHAIQKVAVAQASATTRPVTEIVKALFDLTARAIARVYRDERAGRFAAPQDLGAHAAVCARDGGEGAYLFRGALAKVLAPFPSWNAKLEFLLDQLRGAPAPDAARQLFLGSLDALIAEIVSGNAALAELLGNQPDLGHALLALTDVFLGQATRDATPLAALADAFARGELVAARAAIGHRIIAEIAKPKRLTNGSVSEEIQLMRRLAARVVLGQGALLDSEDILDAFVQRSRRLVLPETVETLLKESETPEDRIEHLLMLEENVIGAENKRRVVGYLRPVVTAHATESWFVQSPLPPLTKLQKLASLAQRLRRTSCHGSPTAECIQAIEAIAVAVEAKARLIETIATGPLSPPDKAIAALKLLAADLLPPGETMQRAKRIALRHGSEPGFIEAYVQRALQRNDRPATSPQHALAELRVLTERAGTPILKAG